MIKFFDILIAACLYALVPTYGWSPPIGALLGGIAAAVGISTAALTTVAVQLAVSWSLSQVSNYLRQRALKKANRDGGLSIPRKKTGGANSRTIILGRYATAGSEVTPPMSRGSSGKTPNIFLTYVVALADTPIDKVNRVIINGEYVDIKANVDTDYGNHLGGKYFQGAYRPETHAFLQWYDGKQTTADAALVRLFGNYPDRPWSADMVGKGVAYAIITFRYNTDLFKGEPEVKYEVEGALLYDPRKDSSVGGSGPQRWNNPNTWGPTRNPLIMAYNVYRGIPLGDGRFYGVGMDAAELPLDNWVAAMNVCDETVDGEPRYEAGIEILVDTDEPADIIDDLLAACDGQVAEIGGTVKVRAGGPGLPVAFFEDTDFIVNREQDFDPFPATNQTHNIINAVYPHPGELWNQHDAPAVFRQADIDRDGEERPMALTLNAVYRSKQAQRIQWSMLKDDQRHRSHNGSLGPYALHLEPLDVFSWTSKRNMYSSKLFDITAITENLNNLCGGYAFREVDPTDYSPEAVLLPDPVASGGWQLPALQAVPGFHVEPLSILDKTGRSRRPVARVSWDPEAAQDVEALRIVIEHVQSGRQVAQKTVARPGLVEFVDISEGLLPEENYRAAGIFAVDRPVQWSSWFPFTTLPATLVVVTEDDFSEELREKIANDMREVAEKVGIKPVDDLPASGEPNQIIVKIPENRLYRWDVNANGGAGGWSEDLYAGIPPGAIDETKFAQGIEPNTIIPQGDPLPTTKLTNNIVWNGSLYTWNGTKYTTPSFSLTPGIVKEIHIADAAVTVDKIVNSAITAVKLANGAVTRDKILDGAISELKIANGAVTDAKIAGMAASKVTGQLTDAQLAGISAAKLAGQITTTQITDNAISTGKIAAGAVETAKLAAGAVVADKIASNAITAVKIAAGAVETAKLAAGAVETAKLAAGAVVADKIAANAITADKIATDAITARTIQAGAVGADQIAANAIVTSKLAVTDFTNLVTNSDLTLDSGVTGSSDGWLLQNDAAIAESPSNQAGKWGIAFPARTSGDPAAVFNKLVPVKSGDEYHFSAYFRGSGNNARSTHRIGINRFDVDRQSVGSAIVVSDDVTNTTVKLLEGSYTVPAGVAYIRFVVIRSANSDQNGVTYVTLPTMRRKNGGELIVDGAITAAKVAANAITANALAANSVTSDALAANSVTAGIIAANAVTADKIAANAITAAKIAAGAVGADQIAARAIVASKLAVSDFENLILNDQFETDDGWGFTPNVFVTRGFSNATTPRYLSFPDTSVVTYAQFGYGNRVTVKPGEEIAFGCRVRASGSGDPKFTAYFRADFFDKNGGVVSTPVTNFAAQTSTGFSDRSGSLIVPTGAVTATFRFGRRGDFSGEVNDGYIELPYVRRKNGGELIVDGAITANKLAADSVTANAIAAGAIVASHIAAGAVVASKINVANLAAIGITVGNADIVNGAISNAKIANGAISSAKIADAAITNAHIQNLSVDTIKIKDNAISTYESSYTSGSIDAIGGQSVSLQTLTYTPGRPGPQVFTIFFNMTQGSGNASRIRIIRTANGQNTLIAAKVFPSGMTSSDMTDTIVDPNPPAGQLTYTMTYDSTNPGSGTTRINQRFIGVLNILK